MARIQIVLLFDLKYSAAEFMIITWWNEELSSMYDTLSLNIFFLLKKRDFRVLHFTINLSISVCYSALF